MNLSSVMGILCFLVCFPLVDAYAQMRPRPHHNSWYRDYKCLGIDSEGAQREVRMLLGAKGGGSWPYFDIYYSLDHVETYRFWGRYPDQSHRLPTGEVYWSHVEKKPEHTVSRKLLKGAITFLYLDGYAPNAISFEEFIGPKGRTMNLKFVYVPDLTPGIDYSCEEINYFAERVLAGDKKFIEREFREDNSALFLLRAATPMRLVTEEQRFEMLKIMISTMKDRINVNRRLGGLYGPAPFHLTKPEEAKFLHYILEQFSDEYDYSILDQMNYTLLSKLIDKKSPMWIIRYVLSKGKFDIHFKNNWKESALDYAKRYKPLESRDELIQLLEAHHSENN